MGADDDGRGGLADPPFSYRTGKDGEVFISWRGRRAAVLGGRRAASFLARVAGLDAAGQQLAMAKVTGNFKRGNERSR
ncbi:MAG: hypothetical protein MUC56_05860 [Thermoanaerobaculales bacterium]|jgi:hypothetical protein|nr:hypothetical protein [Thermoanaerobaculales bacterium]